jgi:hypothetical protein
MGWKAVKDHYRIGHIVHMSGDDLLIGGAYVSEIIRVSPEGVVEEKPTMRPLDGELARYVYEIRGDASRFRGLLASKDEFTASTPVYGWSGSTIVEDFCEEYGWPNVTHSGALMWDGHFFLDRDDAVRRAVAGARGRMSSLAERVEELEEKLAERKRMLAGAEGDLNDLRSRHASLAAEVESRIDLEESEAA